VKPSEIFNTGPWYISTLALMSIDKLYFEIFDDDDKFIWRFQFQIKVNFKKYTTTGF
jgi:hypothetical protein